MSSYTCMTCRVAFSDSDIQRQHYKTDWHRYNLKRKIAELAPVTAEVFQEKVFAQRAEVDAKEQEKNTTMRCESCCKNFSSGNAFKNHMQSKKHNEIVLRASKTSLLVRQPGNMTKKVEKIAKEDEEENMVEEDDEDGEIIEDDSLEITQCLFCPHESQTYEENLRHMSRSHSFFLPDLEYIVDLKGFLEYLGEKVGLGKVCLYCNEKGKKFHTVEAAQSHMVDKGHMKIDYEGDAALEYSDYYDFSTSYPSDNPDKEIDETASGTLSVDETTNELCLPSGARAGHRELRHYYRQNLPPEKDIHQLTKIRKSIMADYKALGWHGTIGEGAKQKIKDIHKEQRHQARHDLKLSLKANKQQKYFRPQVVF
ncbi:predicted protein [Nematostella vectensis]|uniref:C2H2-type domain-containing protein n=1 Tax=Nematostella vectensis TaxID=45351 RepID=A7S1H2_NEMVE|nr:zinc finger protein 622 [Nematostella vectensis]EDO42506.1 predicted protein [Nematostella vectensis]|eukprot:XP_001634569.1 predicted protein [Nematostella vectensis]